MARRGLVSRYPAWLRSCSREAEIVTVCLRLTLAKSGGDFKSILTHGDPELWESHRAGDTSEQLKKVITKVLSEA